MSPKFIGLDWGVSPSHLSRHQHHLEGLLKIFAVSHPP